MGATPDWLKPAMQAINIDDEGRACKDIPEAACRQEGGNVLRHVASLSLSKSADGLVDPKLVLSWLLTTLGAPALFIGMLVPIREAGALLPQLFTAGFLRSIPQRKWVWSVGAACQGLSAIAIALSGLFLEGRAAGMAVLGALAVLALARSVCSVCYKDVLGKTVDKSKRGQTTGLAGSLSAVVVIIYALLLSFGLLERMTLVISGLFLAGAAWLLGSLIFTGLKEEPGATEGGKNAFKEAMKNVSLLGTETQLRRFIIVRALLTATALAPPFMVSAASQQGQGAFEALGFLVLASASASLISSYVWGWLSDRSSRKVLIFSGLVAAVALVITLVLMEIDGLGNLFALPLILFILMIAYQGVRLGRSTHLVDMADKETRAAFTALSNTVIGIILLFGGLFGVLAETLGLVWVLGLMAVMCVLAAFIGLGLDEVQENA